jgi:cytochrome c oxidase subunit 3
LAHHFDDLTQQHAAGVLGMWAFLTTEVLLFGALFTGYTVYRIKYADVFAAASGHLDIRLGTVNTAILISSSLTMALAVFFAQAGRRRLTLAFLGLTMVLGLVFLGIKAFEWTHDYHEGLVPAVNFTAARWEQAGLNARHAQLYFSLYFLMTGLHALHMVVGLGVMIWIAARAARNEFSAEYYTPVELMGLYWHFVDIVWIFLFPLFYLIGTRATF